MSGRSIQIVVYGGSLVVVLLQFLLIDDHQPAQGEWSFQFFFLLSILAVLLAALAVTTRAHRRYAILAFIFATCVVLAVPFRNAIEVRIPLLVLVIVAGRMSGSALAMTLATLLYLGSLLFSIDLKSHWYPEFGRPSPSELVAMFFVAIIFLVFQLNDLFGERRLSSARFAITRLRGSVEELSKANQGYISFLQFARANSALEERKRITRDIHDGIGYSLTNIMMLSQVANEECGASQHRLKELVEAIRVQAKTGLFDTRRALRFLRSEEAELPQGMQAIRSMLEVFERATGVEVRFRPSVGPGIVENETVFSTIYRFVQEALTNAFRHGHATKVEVTFLQDGSWLILTVRDNGVGAQSVEQGIGFQGMQERLSSLGG